MKINEFIEYMKKNTNKNMKDDQFMAIAKKVLEVKQYLNISAKRDLVNKIIEDCIYYDNGIYKFDGIQKYVYFTMYVIDTYTNLELSEDVEYDFDILSESGLLPIVIGSIGKEYDDINILLQLKSDDILMDNAIEAQFGKLCTNIIDILDNVQNKIGVFADNLQIDKLLKNKENLVKIMNTPQGD